jgi:DNA helicase-2/ATP-dependent DNA helicase PcrA
VNLVSTILHSLSDPTSIAKLTNTFHSLYEVDEKITDTGRDIQMVAGILRKCQRVEEYLWPIPGSNWLEKLKADGVDEVAVNWLEEFRNTINTWQNATLLPIDQLVLTISQSIFSAPADLALAHKLALAMEQSAGSHPDWHLPEFINELDSIVRNERKFSGFGDEDQGFDPEQHRGKAVITTLHKAKGLEWDRVYFLSANNYDFPAGDETDRYMAEKWFIKGKLNLEAEALAQLTALANDDLTGLHMEVGIATYEARLDYARERLRLMFVGITRAKKELYISWNSGKAKNCHAAVALSHLDEYWKEKMHELEP